MRASRESLLLMLCAGLGLLAACARKEEPAATTPAPTPSAAPASTAAPSAAADVPASNEPPAESGLAIKRGIAMLAQDRMTFRPCDDKREWWVVDQTEGVLGRERGRPGQRVQRKAGDRRRFPDHSAASSGASSVSRSSR